MKPIKFCGRTLEVVREYPDSVKSEMGYQLDRVQRGLEPTNWRPMPAVGPGVREIRLVGKSNYRIIYLATLVDSIYVLHVFEKKTRKTSRQDLVVARTALHQLRARSQ